MLIRWLKNRRRKKVIAKPFPEHFRKIIKRNVKHYSYLDDQEKSRLEDLIKVFLDENNFEGCNGLEITDEIRVSVAAQACLLLLGLKHDFYSRLSSILVYPSTVVLPESPVTVFTNNLQISREGIPISGQAFMRGPVILVWDTVRENGRHPERGHNVVYHEFAHIIDMFDGRADGTPLLSTRPKYKLWASICTREFFQLKENRKKGKKNSIDYYGATNEAEFFAVVTEHFFDRPGNLKRKHPELYSLMQSFYNQDTLQRETNYRKNTK